MGVFKRLIVEVHRRSLWQVLAIYAVGSWGSLQVVDGLTDTAGLPGWVPGFALVLLVIGFPVVMATAFVQEGLPGQGEAAPGGSDGAASGSPTTPGRSAAPAECPPALSEGPAGSGNLASGTGSLDLPSTRKPTYHRLFTWRNAILGGVGAFALLGVCVAGYFFMRITGIGPVASLAAQGVFEEREPVVLAEFGNATSDTTLGRMVTEALRIDLHESTAVSLLPPAYLADALQRTGRTPGEPLTAAVAREIALRDGIKGVVQGEVGQVGSGYVLTASIVEPGQGAPLAVFRETAGSGAELLDAIDRLSTRIREKAGESLRTIRAGEPLSAVTTRSLEALRAYTRAMQLAASGDTEGTIRALESAIELDPDFAMAHRRLAAELGNVGFDAARMRDAATRAYELRSRLPRTERLHTEAFYHWLVTGDVSRAVEAYRQLLREHPDEPGALNNLAILLTRTRAGAEEAVELFRRGIALPTALPSQHQNLAATLWSLRRDGELESALAEAERSYPDNYFIARIRAILFTFQGRHQEAHAAADSLLVRLGSSAFAQVEGRQLLAVADAARGRLREAREHAAEAGRIAEERDWASLVADATAQLALTDLLVGGAPERAVEALRQLETDAPFDSSGLGALTLATVAVAASLAGDAELAARAADALDRIAPPGTRSDDDEAGAHWAAYAVAMTEGDAERALEAIDAFELSLFGPCEGRRCAGSLERGMALERLDRLPEAVAAYETHLSGLQLGLYQLELATPWVLERLGELHERQGDAARAAEYYGRFAELWNEADPELQPRVRRARERAAALVGARG